MEFADEKFKISSIIKAENDEEIMQKAPHNVNHGSKSGFQQGEQVWQALSKLIELKMSLLIVEKLDKMTFKGPFQLKIFYDSMIPLKVNEKRIYGSMA
ncbi:hypothetical protein llap_6321 [Limosa lapponica baueri]|uniref:Uncharacterized protein n=1 Tax=Limosa lapponica baueri TaxID=1758121 RepID=A0A2I0UBD7_LIMLA|nr:hypothetical protein llap_6321 [Limosa lapponica baueri]